MTWESVRTIPSRSYICGHCHNPLASNNGFRRQIPGGGWWYIYICHYCNCPTFFDLKNNQIPGSPYGNKVDHVPTEVDSLYNEARDCTSVNAYTASVLCCRKLLMNIGVSIGADEGLNFTQYVRYLSDKGFVPPDGKEWVDHIRKKGNEATHEIAIMEREDAQELITFLEMLLKFIYEFPASIRKKTPDNKAQE